MHKSLFFILKLLIVAFWLGMAFLLVQRVSLTPEMTVEVTEELRDQESFMSIYMKDQKVGYSEQSLAQVRNGYNLNQNTYLRLNLMGSVQEIRTMTSARLTESMALNSFNFFMSAGPIRYQLSGQLNGMTLELTSTTGGGRTQSSLLLEEVPRLAGGLMPYIAGKGLEKGDRFRTPVFDPSTLSSKPVTLVVEDTEILNLDGREVETFRLRMDFHDTQSYTWVDREGRVIKEEGLLGLRMVRTTEEEAKSGITGRADLADLVEATSAPSSMEISNPRNVKYLKARLKGLSLEGFELDGGRQTLTDDVVEVRRETIDVRDEKPLPIRDEDLKQYLEPTQFVQSRHRKIVAQARSLTGGLTSPLEVIDETVGWVYETLEKRPTMSVPSALDVLENKVGDCNEHAALAAALLRAAGVPTRMAVGVLYFEGRFYYHAWLEVYYGRWMAVDPLSGQVPADATHIRFLTGELDKQADMVRVIGRLEVEVLEVD